ncbi:MAG: arsenate reductase family protein [Balneolaceae bacterium]
MIQVYGIKNCDKVRKTITWFKDKQIDYEFIDLKKEPLLKEELQDFVDAIGIDPLLNRRGTTWRKLGLNDKDLDDEQLFEKLLENQMMIKRPVLIKNDSILVGYDEDAFEAFIE